MQIHILLLLIKITLLELTISQFYSFNELISQQVERDTLSEFVIVQIVVLTIKIKPIFQHLLRFSQFGMFCDEVAPFAILPE